MAWGDCGSDEDDEAVGRSAASGGRGRRRSIAAEKQWGEIDAAAAAEAGSCRLSPTGSSSSSSIEVIEEHSGGNSRPSLKSDAGGKRPSKSVPSFTRDGRMRHGGHNGYAKSGFSPGKPPPKRIAAAGGGSSGQVAAGTARRLRAPASGPLRSTSSGAGRAGSISVAARLPSAQTSVHASSGLHPSIAESVPRKTALLMENALGTRDDPRDPNRYSRDFLVKRLTELQESKLPLLEYAKAVDLANGEGPVLQTYLNENIPSNKVAGNTSKVKASKALVDIWRGLVVVIGHPRGLLSSSLQGKLDQYIAMMENQCKDASALVEEEEGSSSVKSVKISADERSRGYLQGGATRPRTKAEQNCPDCGMHFVHYPPENKAMEERNKQKRQAWEKDCKEWERWLKNPRSEPPKDLSGKVMKKAPPPPRYESPIGVCKAYTLCHSLSVDGYKCPSCNDRSCETCTNKCSFAFKLKERVEIQNRLQLQKESQKIQQESAREKAQQVLSLSIRSGEAASASEKSRLLKMKREGLLDQDVDPSRVQEQANWLGAHVASLGILQLQPSRDVQTFLDEQITNVQHPKGPTHTALGDMRTYGGGGAAKKRAKNTGLHDEDSLHFENDLERAIHESAQSFQSDQARIEAHIRNSNQVASAPQEADGFSLDRESAFASAKGAQGGISSNSRKPLASMDTDGRGCPFASQQGGSTVTPKFTQRSELELKIAKLKEGVEDEMMIEYMDIEENSSKKVKFNTIFDGLHKEDHELHKRLNIVIRICAKKDNTVAETIQGLMKLV